jgi:hypothetical protein
MDDDGKLNECDIPPYLLKKSFGRINNPLPWSQELETHTSALPCVNESALSRFNYVHANPKTARASANAAAAAAGASAAAAAAISRAVKSIVGNKVKNQHKRTINHWNRCAGHATMRRIETFEQRAEDNRRSIAATKRAMDEAIVTKKRDMKAKKAAREAKQQKALDTYSRKYWSVPHRSLEMQRTEGPMLLREELQMNPLAANCTSHTSLSHCYREVAKLKFSGGRSGGGRRPGTADGGGSSYEELHARYSDGAERLLAVSAPSVEQSLSSIGLPLPSPIKGAGGDGGGAGGGGGVGNGNGNGGNNGGAAAATLPAHLQGLTQEELLREQQEELRGFLSKAASEDEAAFADQAVQGSRQQRGQVPKGRRSRASAGDTAGSGGRGSGGLGASFEDMDLSGSGPMGAMQGAASGPAMHVRRKPTRTTAEAYRQWELRHRKRGRLQQQRWERSKGVLDEVYAGSVTEVFTQSMADMNNSMAGGSGSYNDSMAGLY